MWLSFDHVEIVTEKLQVSHYAHFDDFTVNCLVSAKEQKKNLIQYILNFNL